MKVGDKVWRSEYGRVDHVTVIAVDGHEACVRAPKHGLVTCNAGRLFKTKTAAVASTAPERIRDLRKAYEAIARCLESFRNEAKAVLEAFEAHDQP